MRYYIPGTSRFKETPRGSILVYVALMVLSAAASAFGCLLLAGSYAFSRVSSIAWTLVGLFFGWVGLVLMLAVQEWPARVSCPNCRRLRVVTRDTCEHCGALHALPEPDGAEILESAATVTQVALIAR
jgi:hypothetical protein